MVLDAAGITVQIAGTNGSFLRWVLLLRRCCISLMYVDWRVGDGAAASPVSAHLKRYRPRGRA